MNGVWDKNAQPPTSPLLFNIYIDDFIEYINPIEFECIPDELKRLLFADYTVIAAKNYEDLENGQTLNWEQSSKMWFNAHKSFGRDKYNSWSKI
jgi:hypothetical protein